MFREDLPVYNGPSTDCPLSKCALSCTILGHFFCIFHPFHFFHVAPFFVLLHVAITSYCTFFCVALISCCTFAYCTLFKLHLFSCCFMLHSCSCYTFFVLHSFRVAISRVADFSSCTLFHVAPFCIACCTFFMLHLFACYTFFMLHLFCSASCCTHFLLHFFRVALISCCTFSVLHFLHVVLFSCCTCFRFALFSCCTLLTLDLFS